MDKWGTLDLKHEQEGKGRREGGREGGMVGRIERVVIRDSCRAAEWAGKKES